MHNENIQNWKTETCMKPVAWRQSQLKQNNYPIEKVMAHFHEGIQLSNGLILYIQAKRP